MEATEQPAPDPEPAPKCKLVQAGPAALPAAPRRVARIDDANAPAFAAKTFVQVSQSLQYFGVSVTARDNCFLVQVDGQLPYIVKTALELQAFAAGFLRGQKRLPQPEKSEGNATSGGEPEDKQ